MAGNDKSGRTSELAGLRLFKQLDENPHREGTHGWFAWEALKEAMVYEAYRDTPNAHLNYLRDWVANGWVEARQTKK